MCRVWRLSLRPTPLGGVFILHQLRRRRSAATSPPLYSASRQRRTATFRACSNDCVHSAASHHPNAALQRLHRHLNATLRCVGCSGFTTAYRLRRLCDATVLLPLYAAFRCVLRCTTSKRRFAACRVRQLRYIQVTHCSRHIILLNTTRFAASLLQHLVHATTIA